MKFVGEVNLSRRFKCVKCGSSLRGDHGVMDQTGAVCINRMKCGLRVSRERLDALAAQGIKPRWR